MRLLVMFFGALLFFPGLACAKASTPHVFEAYMGDSASQGQLMLFTPQALDSIVKQNGDGSIIFRERHRIERRLKSILGRKIMLCVLRVSNHEQSRDPIFLDRNVFTLFFERPSRSWIVEERIPWEKLEDLQEYFPKDITVQPNHVAYTMVTFPHFDLQTDDRLGALFFRMNFSPLGTKRDTVTTRTR